jgi:hypothetical protein
LGADVPDVLVFDAVLFQRGNDFRVSGFRMSLNVASNSFAFAHRWFSRFRGGSSVADGMGSGIIRGGFVDQLRLRRVHEGLFLSILGQIKTPH